jgi:two-component system capsular synthesis sensor histidine kinase RcsC
LELRTDEAQGTTSVIHRFTEGARRSLRVLVVEDEAPTRRVLVDYLTFDGYVVETAANGREGLDTFHVGQFDVVITDWMMPDVNGSELAAVIKQSAPQTPAILLTGFSELLDTMSQSPPVVALVISKPSTLTALRRALAKVLAK